MLAGEKRGILAKVVGQRPLGRPLRRVALPVARLVEHGVDRIAPEGERGHALDVVDEGRRADGELDDVVQPLEAVAHAEHVPERAKAA